MKVKTANKDYIHQSQSYFKLAKISRPIAFKIMLLVEISQEQVHNLSCIGSIWWVFPSFLMSVQQSFLPIYKEKTTQMLGIALGELPKTHKVRKGGGRVG